MCLPWSGSTTTNRLTTSTYGLTTTDGLATTTYGVTTSTYRLTTKRFFLWLLIATATTNNRDTTRIFAYLWFDIVLYGLRILLSGLFLFLFQRIDSIGERCKFVLDITQRLRIEFAFVRYLDDLSDWLLLGR